MLKEQLEKGREELDYINSVLDTVDRAENEKDLAQIREELTEQGYLKVQKGKSPVRQLCRRSNLNQATVLKSLSEETTVRMIS